MANFPKMVLTSKGVSLQAKVQGGAQLALTRMALGDGQLGGTPISGLNALVSQKVTLPLTGGKRVSTQTYQVEAFFSNTTISTGFWWREWGVFATDPDVGEILYCYANAGDAGDYIAPSTDTRIEKYLYASMAVGNASNITVEVSSSDIYITAQELAAHAEDTTKHIGTAAKTTPVEADSLALVDSADGSKLKRLSWANLKAALSTVFAAAAHTHSGVYEPAFTKNSAFNKAFETLVSNIKMNGAASVGSSNNVARADHIHPVDTSRAAASHKSNHATGGADALTPADIGAAVTTTLSATLSTTWTGSSAPFTQTVSVAGILSTDNPVIDVVLSADAAASKLIMEAWANVSRIVTANGSITAHCYESKPTVAIPIQLKVVR